MKQLRSAISLVAILSAPACFGQDMAASVVLPGPSGPNGGVVGAASQSMNLGQGPGMGLSSPKIDFGQQPSILHVYTPQVQLGGSLQSMSQQTPAMAQQQPAGLGLPSALPQTSPSAQQNAGRVSPTPSRAEATAVPGGVAQPGGAVASQPDGAQSQAPRALTREGGPGRIGGPELDPRVQPGERPGRGALGAMGDIDKARKRESKGGPDANVSGKLDALFDFSQNKNASMLNSMSKGPSGMQEMTEAGALPDPRVVGVDQAVSKTRALAASAAETDAPFLYQSALGMAREQLPASKSEGMMARILKDAWKKAPAAVKLVGQGALDAAAQGRTTDALRYTKAVHAWNALLSSQKGSFIVNFPEFRDAVKHVLGQALGSKGSTLPSPKVEFKAVEAGERSPRKALLSFPKEMAGQVTPVPARLAEILALDRSIVAWETQAAPETPGLSAAFALTPQGGFRDFYRARRAAGDSVLKSFWLASRQFMGAAAAGFWHRVKDFLFAVLRFFGIVSGTAPSMTVEPSADALKELRSLPGQKLELPSGLPAEKDAVGLGYRLHRVAP